MPTKKTPAPPPEEPNEETVMAEIVEELAEEPAEQPDDVQLEHVDEATGEIADDVEDIVDAHVEDDHPVFEHAAVLTLLPTSSDSREWTEEQKALLDAAGLVKRQNGQTIPAPRATIAAFLTQCHRTQLDPIARQIYCIERAGKWTIQISIDGFRLIAERTHQYRGQTAAQWTADGITWTDVWLAKTPPAAARVGVYREGFVEPVWGVATYEGYCPRDRNSNLDPRNQWKTNPSNQLAKCAEMLALRKAFPQELSGLYGTEEMDQADGRATPAARPKVTQQPSLRALHAAGVDEHKIAAPDGDTGGDAMGQPVASPPQPISADVERWLAWKEQIDAADTIEALTAVRAEMEEKGLLALPVPGVVGRTVADYFNYRRAQLKPAATGSMTERLQQGLKLDQAEAV